jgi:hypothetical protein
MKHNKKSGRADRLLLALGAAGLAACVSMGGCQQKAQDASAPTTASAAPAIELPPNAAPDPALAPFAFMTGRWIGVNPNKTVNEEHWTAARGKSMAALFRQVRRDGFPAFHEISLITAEPDGVVLRLRHLHRQLEVPNNRPGVNVFKLVSAGNNRAEFAGTGDAEGVTSVVYRLVDANTLAVDIAFAPTSKEKGFTSTYTREP